ncbi:toll-like receptor 13 [Colossoma macropomum]|uniref:toll-like receptor 13 n=1 Tax=Colossoma macropomum TaxID=42526 RepID=UPI001863B941|nr:toll-like receptor 13 [Colossoma macropomum]
MAKLLQTALKTSQTSVGTEALFTEDMKSLVYLIALVLYSTNTQGWQLKKCKTDKFASVCSGDHAAFCDHVTDIKVDTAGLPSDIQNLCITMEKHKPHGSLVNGSFSHFTSLEYLQIFGCFFQFHPGAFRGLSNLRRLDLDAEKCCEIAMSRQVFKDLPQLKELNIASLNLSVVATDIFYDLSQMEKISFDNLCSSVFSELICSIINLTSLKEFVFITNEEETLEYPNCTHKNESVFPRISGAKLFFSRIKHFHQGALDFFQNLSSLGFSYNDKLLSYLPRSGIKSVDVFHYCTDTLVVEEVCIVVSKLSTKNLSLYFQTASNFSHFKNDNCTVLEQLHITAYGTQPIDLSFICFMTNLTTLEINGKGLDTHFRSICTSTLKVTWLTDLTVMFASVSKIFSHQFSCLVNLKMLNITCCSVSEIEPFAFMELVSLRILNLQYNNITAIGVHVFDGLYNLLVLDLKNNPLFRVEQMAFRHLMNLQELHFSYFGSSPIGFVIRWNLTDIFGNIPEQLAYLFYEYIVPMELIIGSNMTLNQNLTLHVRSVTLNIEDCGRPFFESVTTLFARTKHILCGSEFIGKYIKNIENLMYISKFSDKIGDLTSLNELVHLKVLRLDDMDLSKQSNVAVMFHNLTKLEKLSLFYCRFFSIDGTLTKDLKSLRFLRLMFRDYVTVYSGFFEPLTSLKNLGIYQLQLFCNCDNADFSKWVKENKKVQVEMMDPELDELQCLSNNGLDRPNLQVYGKQNCFFELDFVLFVLTSLGVIFFMLVVLIQRMAVYYIFSLYHIAHAWFEQAVRKDRRVQYRYDAFVSYSSKDENWVVNELLPSLEQRGPPFLRLCLHSRDFQLGKDVVENITDSLYESRYTLCLVSRNYLCSHWCSLEMRLATCRLQVEHKDVLILVFLEKIPSRLLSAHHRLARLVKSRTYLDWPQDPDHHNAFWDRLWDKLKPEAMM